MINIIDIVVLVLALLFFIRNAGGPVKILRTIAALAIFLVIFGLIAQFILGMPLSQPVKNNIYDSYSYKISRNLVSWIYPPIKNAAPKIDSFISDKMLSSTPPEINITGIASAEKILKNITVPELPNLK